MLFIIIDLLFPCDDVPKAASHQIAHEHLNPLKNSVLLPLYMCLFKCTQNTVMNKQLFYRLLDVLLEEIFPELRTQLNEQK